MNKLKQLWNNLAKKNARYYINSDKGKGITEEEFRDSGLDDYIKYIDNDNLMHNGGMIFLEIGCGIGRMTEFIDKEYEVIGIDISREMIKRARERLPNVFFRETDGETIPFLNDSIDIAFSYLVFQHFKERKMVEKNFEEVYRVLKPGGIFKVRIRSDKVDLDRWWGGVEYTEQSIGQLIKKVGFELLKTEPVGDYGFWLWLRK